MYRKFWEHERISVDMGQDLYLIVSFVVWRWGGCG
jgi:hypothetical protein